jgi:NAD-dependent SIR2 family protein deacetylase
MAEVGNPGRNARTDDHPHSYDPGSGCSICRNKRPFDFPDKLLETCLGGELVIFAGAGISTESPLVYPRSLYEELRARCSPRPNGESPFSTVMSAFEKEHGRAELLKRIKGRIDYVDSYFQLRYMATRFHRELATLFPIAEIVTTNWDTYFESVCGAIPIVIPEDYAFWKLPGRKVYKIHGSISNVGSIIATEKNYKDRYKSLRAGIIGASLKHMLATKTVVFAGYSFGDEDFTKIYKFLREELGAVLPRSYIVTLDESFPEEKYPESTVIVTDAAYFLSELKRRLGQTHHFLHDGRFDGVPAKLAAVRQAHLSLVDKFEVKDHPEIIYATCYQDGLMDGLDRIESRTHTGEYSHICELEHKISSYLELRKRNLRARRYEDVAYIDGYKNALIYLISDDDVRAALPLFYVFGADDEDLLTLTSFRRASRETPERHKAAYRRAQRLADAFPSRGLVFQHPPFFSFNP